jgi:hypothetical protein
MLRMGQVQGCVNFVQNVHRSRLKLKEGHDEGKSNQRSILFRVNSISFFVAFEHAPLSTTQFSQTLLPHWSELNLDFQAIHEVLSVGRLEFRKVTRKKFCKDLSEIPIKRKKGILYSWLSYDEVLQLTSSYKTFLQVRPGRLEGISLVLIRSSHRFSPCPFRQSQCSEIPCVYVYLSCVRHSK